MSHLPRAPKLVQAQFLPYLKLLQKDHPNNTRLANYIALHSIDQPLLPSAGPLIHNYAELLQPKALLKKLDDITEYLDSNPSSSTPPKNIEEPIEKLDMLHPDYDYFYRMSKQ